MLTGKKIKKIKKKYLVLLTFFLIRMLGEDETSFEYKTFEIQYTTLPTLVLSIHKILVYTTERRRQVSQ